MLSYWLSKLSVQHFPRINSQFFLTAQLSTQVLFVRSQLCSPLPQQHPPTLLRLSLQQRLTVLLPSSRTMLPGFLLLVKTFSTSPSEVINSCRWSLTPASATLTTA